MDWVKLPTDYPNRDAMLRAGEAAEILYTRALAHCGRIENDGFVPREMLARLTPLRGSARARSLVREGIWEIVPGGWRFTSDWWEQITREQLATKRRGARERQSRHRQTKGPRNGVTDAVSHAEVTRTEVEVEVEAAAAAGDDAAAAATLAGPIDVLRSKLQAHTPLRALRFDNVAGDQADRLLALVELHGDDPLVRVAIDTCRNPPPVHVGAFLGTWEALPAPGTRHLGVVRPGRCTIHDTQLNSAGGCSSCAADQKAGNA